MAEATQAAVVNVIIEGLRGEARDNVRAALTLLQRQRDPALTEATIRTLHAQAGDEIRRALQPFGFYRADIEAVLEAPDASGDAWRARYRIEPGRPVRFSAVNLSLSGPGRGDPALADLQLEPPLLTGEVLDHRRYERAKASLLTAVQKRGYRDARFSTHRVEVAPDSYSATAILTVATGQRYVFGDLHFGETRFADSYLEKYRVIKPGAPFDRTLLAEQRKALSSSGHFREVQLEAGEPRAPGDGSDPRVPVLVNLTPFEPNRYRGRLGWGTETGVGFRLDWTRRHLGAHGHRFNLGATVVEERERVAADLRYRIPLVPLADHNFELGLRHESKDLNFRDVDLDEGGETRIAANFASLLWNLPDSRLGPFDLQLSAGLSAVGESYDVFEVLFGNLPDSVQQTIIGFIGSEAYDTLAPDFRAIVPEFKASLVRSDARLYIRRGDYLGVRLLGASRELGSNISFWQARLSHWSIWPLGQRSRFLMRSALGYSEAESREVLGVTFNQMPEFYEFRGGGARNIRGYGFETLFPEDGVTGGRHQIIASFEYEREIVPDWSGAIFLDGGNVFNEWSDYETKLGAGLGVRWRSPVGPVRVDVGFPLDDADSAFQLYVTVGPEF